MSENIINGATLVKHPKEEGVFLKHCFNSSDNDRLNNLEVTILPGFHISPHVHADSTEFYYVVSGTGEFLVDGEWRSIKKGDALKAPMAMEHGLKNTGSELLMVFSTFSPATR
ncbi:MAG: cupin domain-containing protein [Syntrophomonadaceae bacterium]|jgi:mannose-6-phosphate isomerase-like protein (cupin superfamily)